MFQICYFFSIALTFCIQWEKVVIAETPPNYIGEFSISRYYTPIPDQRRYYHWTYEKDFKINCSGDCLVTASGYRLAQKDEFAVVACPRTFKLRSKLRIEGVWDVTCQDRGGAIKWNRLDLWTGIGDRWLTNIWSYRSKAWIKKVYLLSWSYDWK